MDRTIPGPDNDVLTKDEVCRYLRIDQSHLDTLVRRGEFPRPVPYGAGGKLPVWYWEDCWAWRHLRMRLAGAPPPPENEAPEGADRPEK